MANRLFNELNGIIISEFAFTSDEIQALQNGDMYEVLSLPKFSAQFDDLISSLNAVASDIEGFQGDVAKSIGQIQDNKSLLSDDATVAQADELDLGNLLDIVPINDFDVQESPTMVAGLEGIHDNYIEFTEGNAEILYRVSQMDNRLNYLNTQNDNLIQSRTFINQMLQVISQIQAVQV